MKKGYTLEYKADDGTVGSILIPPTATSFGVSGDGMWFEAHDEAGLILMVPARAVIVVYRGGQT